MTRQDYILHLDTLRDGVGKLIAWHINELKVRSKLNAPTAIEEDREKKTFKMFDDLTVRLYEDAGVSEKVKQENRGGRHGASRNDLHRRGRGARD